MSIEVIDYLLNEIRYIHPLSMKQEIVDLTLIKSIFYFLDKGTTLSTNQMKDIRNIILKLKENVNYLLDFRNKILENKEIDQSLFQQTCLTLRYYKVIYFESLNKIKLENDNQKHITYYKKENNWFGKIIIIYLNNDGKLPVSPTYFFKFLQKIFDTLTKDEQQNVISVTEDILGGNNLKLVAQNFQDWICNNVTDIKILKDFLII